MMSVKEETEKIIKNWLEQAESDLESAEYNLKGKRFDVTAYLSQQSSEKACFGTKEWSKNSGICKGCEQKTECGKMMIKNNNP